MTERLSVGASFLYESYRSDDFATDGIAPGSATIPTVVTLSGSVPDYRAQVAVAYLTMEF
ncbi:MAG: MtrB/PioB family outer membrane beta-barrel protein [Candidatus Manganitrophus sp.]|nr:MtrB/PioB family outer membrane beta-barrel protein [Candidatus Manganitrophus sp.]WDT70705.1 MAG: MtrB/PioB family outer membrane beta-barrel protein [Candidatus Manganitrophus sp.]WDT82029.1 MAG: MtrB/PioB family outer membrane beta-barrel protein [Candidatus Manganitrophus sp.]